MNKNPSKKLDKKTTKNIKKTPKILWFKIFEKIDENACMHVI